MARIGTTKRYREHIYNYYGSTEGRRSADRILSFHRKQGDLAFKRKTAKSEAKGNDYYDIYVHKM